MEAATLFFLTVLMWFIVCESCKSTSEDDAMYYKWIFSQVNFLVT